METINTIANKENVIDTTKGQKIIAAVYVVTEHLSDTNPLKKTLRETVLQVVGDKAASAADNVTLYLGAAALSGLISDKNRAIISVELQKLIKGNDQSVDQHLSSLLDTKDEDPLKKTYMSFKPKTHTLTERLPSKNHDEIIENKYKRQQAILSFINDRKSAGIKDIAALFPGLSEKTIQRELGVLVTAGKITKRGNKRWSLYMAVGA
jgi:hypothetical protein